jgi:hypothetical protein
MTHYVVEIQGFTGTNKEFILKELTIMNVETLDVILNALVTSPYPIKSLNPQEQRVIHYIERNIINLRWEDGISTMTEVLHQLGQILKPEDKIYTKGLVKSRCLSKILNRHVTDIGQTSCCPSLKFLRQIKLAADCPFHWNPRESCSLTSARQLSIWMNEHLRDTIFTSKIK